MPQASRSGIISRWYRRWRRKLAHGASGVILGMAYGNGDMRGARVALAQASALALAK